jgi:hypothetical protein
MRGLALGIDVQFRAVDPFLVEENQHGRAVCGHFAGDEGLAEAQVTPQVGIGVTVGIGELRPR